VCLTESKETIFLLFTINTRDWLPSDKLEHIKTLIMSKIIVFKLHSGQIISNFKVHSDWLFHGYQQGSIYTI